MEAVVPSLATTKVIVTASATMLTLYWYEPDFSTPPVISNSM